MLSDKDPQVRDAATYGLGIMTYDKSLSAAKDKAVAALSAQLSKETESWVKADLSSAVSVITTGVATSAAFQKSPDQPQ